MKKIYEEAIIVSMIMVVIISIIQLLVYKSETYSISWHDNMFKTGLILICVFPLIYYFIIRKDVSESVGLFLTSFILWLSGLTDVLYFVFQAKWIPYTLPWLNNHILIGRIKDLLGMPVVTNVLLIICVFVGFIVVLAVDIYLEKIKG